MHPGDDTIKSPRPTPPVGSLWVHRETGVVRVVGSEQDFVLYERALDLPGYPVPPETSRSDRILRKHVGAWTGYDQPYDYLRNVFHPVDAVQLGRFYWDLVSVIQRYGRDTAGQSG